MLDASLTIPPFAAIVGARGRRLTARSLRACNSKNPRPGARPVGVFAALSVKRSPSMIACRATIDSALMPMTFPKFVKAGAAM
jgi:hypothetical protein